MYFTRYPANNIEIIAIAITKYNTKTTPLARGKLGLYKSY
jgi:hypothetical protein